MTLSTTQTLLLVILDAHNKDYTKICYISDQDMRSYHTLPQKYSIDLKRVRYDHRQKLLLPWPINISWCRSYPFFMEVLILKSDALWTELSDAGNMFLPSHSFTPEMIRSLSLLPYLLGLGLPNVMERKKTWQMTLGSAWTKNLWNLYFLNYSVQIILDKSKKYSYMYLSVMYNWNQ